MADCTKFIFEKYPGRRKQIERLLNIIPDSGDVLKSDSFVVEGPPSTGKVSVLLDVLRCRKQPYLFVDCYECFDSALVYGKILEEFFGKHENVVSSVSSLYGFCSAYRKAVRLYGRPQIVAEYIIFKHFDNLETSFLSDIEFLEVRFPDIWHFCSIFVVTNSTFFDVSTYGCLRIHFARYSLEQLREILLLNSSPDSPDTYGSFLQIFLPWIYKKERNLRDLMRLVGLLYPIYRKPVDDGEITSKDLHTLFNLFDPYLKKYSDPTDLLLFNRVTLESGKDVINTNECFNKVDLPFYTKYLLLAAYLASYIPSKQDQMLFCRRGLKKKKKKTWRKKIIKTDNEVNRLTGPKPFPLNRLLAIYFSIVEEHSNISAMLLSQVASLVELKLLAICGKDENIDQPYYKCIAKPTLVSSVAKWKLYASGLLSDAST